ncbi:MAG: methylmalonyl-CoA epimerase [candidate division Zixibacteria bacterium]|nr:methylmalonyl-CoA epimerase [candidate division Zixibacteria bacterium]
MARRIRHIAIAVKDIEKARALFSMISGTPASEAQEVPDQRVKVSFIDTGETKIELIQPTAGNVGVAKFLEKRGEGLHHICLEVDNIEATLTEYKREGIRLIDEQPRVGAEGHRVAFVHPQSTGGVLVEVEEAGH